MDFIFIRSKKKGKEEFGTVYARVRTKGINRKLSTGFTIKEVEWLRYHTRQYNSSYMIGSIGLKYGQFASILTQIKASFEDNFDPQIAGAVIRSIRCSILNGEELHVKDSKNGKNVTLVDDYMEQYIHEMETGARCKRGTSVKVSDGHIQKLTSIYKRIMRYERDRRVTLTLDDVTMDFQRDLVKWYRDNGLSPNSIHGDFMNFSTILKSAYEAKLTKVDDFRNSQFVPKGEPVDHIFLSPDQIIEMLEIDLSSFDKIKEHIENARIKDKDKDKLLEKINETIARQLVVSRDIFIVGCLSGQRFSDYTRICKDMIMSMEDNTFIKLIQEKTGKKVIIPMDKRIGTILDKYDGKLPKIYLTDFNSCLKMLALILGWTYKAKISEERMGSKTSTRFCDLISSHTARRTFATNAYAAGVPLSSIMAITGHSTEQNLRLYLKLQAEDKAIIAAKDFDKIIIT